MLLFSLQISQGSSIFQLNKQKAGKQRWRIPRDIPFNYIYGRFHETIPLIIFSMSPLFCDMSNIVFRMSWQISHVIGDIIRFSLCFVCFTLSFDVVFVSSVFGLCCSMSSLFHPFLASVVHCRLFFSIWDSVVQCRIGFACF